VADRVEVAWGVVGNPAAKSGITSGN
jgi:hypothetical protein